MISRAVISLVALKIFIFVYVWMFLSEGPSEVIFRDLCVVNVGICWPTSCISLTFPCHLIVDGLIFPRCCVLVALDIGSRLILVFVTCWPVSYMF